MNDQQLDDLKQFIDSRLSRSEKQITDKLKDEIEQLRSEMHDGCTEVSEAIEQINQHNDEKSDELELRLSRLGQHQAVFDVTEKEVDSWPRIEFIDVPDWLEAKSKR